jgi:hypothetical protein
MTCATHSPTRARFLDFLDCPSRGHARVDLRNLRNNLTYRPSSRRFVGGGCNRSAPEPYGRWETPAVRPGPKALTCEEVRVWNR